MSAAKHWLVERAERMPLGGLLTSAEDAVAHQFIGACRGVARGDVVKPKLTDFLALVKAEEEAQAVLARRRKEGA
jgi:hypothetical protein